MLAILIIISAVVFFVFKNDWKKSVYLLMFMIPFFGFIQHKTLHLTRFAPLLHDITIVIPMYLLFILNRGKNNNQFYLPRNLINYLLFFIFLILIFAINPFYEVNFVSRLVGIKVWIFYLLFILIGFELIESELELKKLCNFFAIVAIIPSLIGILLYLSSYFIGHLQTMLFFYSGNEFSVMASTQGLTKFDLGGGFVFFRLSSTFSYPTQFSMYMFFSFVPAITSVSLSKTVTEKFFYLIIIGIIILGAYSSGIRSTSLFLILFFIFSILIQARFYTALLFLTFSFILLSFINLDVFPSPLRNLITYITDLTTFYAESYIFKDLGFILSNHFFGNGVGSATAEARFIAGATEASLGIVGAETGILIPVHEGFYHKTILELGVFGLLAVIGFFGLIISEIFLSIRHLERNKLSVFCSVVLSLFLVSIIIATKGASIFTKYPANLLFYFYFGIAIKLRFLNLNEEKIT